LGLLTRTLLGEAEGGLLMGVRNLIIRRNHNAQQKKVDQEEGGFQGCQELGWKFELEYSWDQQSGSAVLVSKPRQEVMQRALNTAGPKNCLSIPVK
jgi:hypothetical protein